MSVQLLAGPERSRALDSASILGGNEYMVSQLVQDQHNKLYLDDELDVIKWSLNALWGLSIYEEFTSKSKIDSQTCFTSLLVPNVRRDLTRLLSSCLLYSVRYEDSKILINPAEPTYRALVVNTKHLSNVASPIGYIGEEKKPCDNLAMVYIKPEEKPVLTATGAKTNPRHLTRKLSQSFHLEQRLLSQIFMIAILPAP